MQTYGYDLSQIAKQDRRPMAETKRAFTEALRVAKKEEGGINVGLERIMNTRSTLRVTLGGAIRLYTLEPNVIEAQDDGGHRRCRRCEKPVTPGSYYWCSKHIPTMVDIDEEFLSCG